jgi:transcription elongation factor Elf1
MVTFDCPWCAEPAMTETPDTGDLACEACGVHADLAPDPIGAPIARAA